MRKKCLSLCSVTLFAILQVFAVLFGVVVDGEALAVDTENFYFEDFSGDYYLSRDENGISHLAVEENFTVVFPDYNQNKGFCRDISFTNQNGANLTLPSLNKSNLTLLRNGEKEPIYSIDKYNDYYEVCTGDDNYVLGKQVYTFKYSFEKVVTDFESYQELYWDTNGNGWTQKFNKVTARVHFGDDVADAYTGNSWCYVGAYGESGQDRCRIKQVDDGVEFVADNLKKNENLTFDVEFKPGTFVVPGPEDNYIYVWLTVILGAICLLCIGLAFRKFIKIRDKAKYYKSIFVKPEYQPSVEYSLPELAEIYLSKKKDVKVAMLLELVVKHKIDLKKGDGKKWSILVKDLNGVDKEYVDLLTILNNGTTVKDGDEIKVERHTSSSKLVALKNSMDKKILDDLKRDELVEKKYKLGDSSSKRGVVNVVMMSATLSLIAIMFGIFILSNFEDALGLNNSYSGNLVFYEYFYTTAFVVIVITSLIVSIIMNYVGKYVGHTLKGLSVVRYMDGLKMYIEMAEADRMKMLQSIEGADVSPLGIVKLYEKLLPYAAVFGLEDSWMDEMKQYCKVEEIEEPDYLMTGIAAAEISRTLRNAAGYATSATGVSSSGGGSSSGFSGGGGGGFSGGGGGGGGGHGR